MLSDVMPGSSDCQMHDAARVRIERPHLLRRTGGFHSFHHEARHLTQFGVFSAAVAHAVNDEAAVVVQVASEAGVHDLLQRVERLCLAFQQHLGTIAGNLDPDRVRRVDDLDGEVEPHGRKHVPDEVTDLRLHIHLSPLHRASRLAATPP